MDALSQELVNRLALAFELISKLAQANTKMLDRIAALELRCTQLEARDAIAKASAR